MALFFELWPDFLVMLSGKIGLQQATLPEMDNILPFIFYSVKGDSSN